MRVLDIGGIPTSLGEIINIKYHLDMIKDQYDQIKLNYHTALWKDSLYVEAPDWKDKKRLWDKYLNELGALFFSEKPYMLGKATNKWAGDAPFLIKGWKMQPQKVNMTNLLCKGKSLDLDEEYIVITTKVRYVKKTIFYPHSIQLWNILQQLSQKYKIVILGEKIVEMRKEYVSSSDSIFGLYDQIICNIPADRILDLTVPMLGETASDLTQIQQDCLIMNEAKFVITIGVGGNFCLSTSVAKMAIGFRADHLVFTDQIFQGKEYPDAIITRDWNHFINVLKRYL